MVAAKLGLGILVVSAANLAVVTFSSTRSGPDAATRRVMVETCAAAAPGVPPGGVGAARFRALDDGHYWVVLPPSGGSGSRPIACDLVADVNGWHAESVTVVEW